MSPSPESRRLWIRAATSLLGQGLNLLLGVAASIPIGRGLGPAGKGDFALYGWGVSLALVLLGGGWHGAVAAIASEDDRRGVAAVRFGRLRLLPVLALLGLAALSCALARSPGWGLAAAAASFQIWGQPASGALVGSGRLSAYYAGVLAQNALLLAGVSALWIREGLTPESAMAVMATAMAGAMLVHSRAAGAGLGFERSGAPPLAGARELSRHVWLADLAAFLNYRLDVALVRSLTGAEGLGLYSTATSIAELGRIPPNAIGQAALRELGRADATGRPGVARRAAGSGLVSSALFVAALAVVSPWLIPRMYGNAFAPSAPLVAWLAPGIVVLAVGSVAASWLAVTERAATTARLGWYGCAASALLSLGLTSALGTTGAAIASSLGYALLAGMLWRAAARG